MAWIRAAVRRVGRPGPGPWAGNGTGRSRRRRGRSCSRQVLARADASVRMVARVWSPMTMGTMAAPGRALWTNGHLDLDRMLFGEGLRPEAEARGLGDLLGQAGVDAGDAERGLEPAVGPDRDALEREAMGGPDDDDGVDGPAADEGVGGRRRPARVDVSGVGHDEADDPAGGREPPGPPRRGSRRSRRPGRPGRPCRIGRRRPPAGRPARRRWPGAGR